MRINFTGNPPNQVSWPPFLPLESCTPKCSPSLAPNSFLSVWVMQRFLFLPADPEIDITGFRHVIAWLAYWYFMSQSGCLTVPPIGYGTNPWTHKNGRFKLSGKEPIDTTSLWGKVGEQARASGAIDPGVIVQLQGINELIRAVEDEEL